MLSEAGKSCRLAVRGLYNHYVLTTIMHLLHDEQLIRATRSLCHSRSSAYKYMNDMQLFAHLDNLENLISVFSLPKLANIRVFTRYVRCNPWTQSESTTPASSTSSSLDNQSKNMFLPFVVLFPYIHASYHYASCIILILRTHEPGHLP